MSSAEKMPNLPNIISATRILLVPIFIILLVSRYYGWAFFVFMIAAVSDSLDGIIARALNQKTALGAYLDPAADKLLSASAYLTLAILGILPGWLTVMVIGRDIIICMGLLVLYHASRPIEIRPSKISKINTVLQFATILAVLLILFPLPLPGAVKDLLIWATAFTTAASGLQYALQWLRIMGQGRGR